MLKPHLSPPYMALGCYSSLKLPLPLSLPAPSVSKVKVAPRLIFENLLSLQVKLFVFPSPNFQDDGCVQNDWGFQKSGLPTNEIPSIIILDSKNDMVTF